MLAQSRERHIPFTDAAHRRVARQIPDDIRTLLSDDQLSRLADAVAPQRTRHGLALQASFAWITGRY